MEKRSRIFSKTNSLTKTPWPWRTSSGELNYTSVGGSGNSVRPVVGPRWRLPIVIKISSLDSTTSGPEISLTGTRLSGRGRGWAGGGRGQGFAPQLGLSGRRAVRKGHRLIYIGRVSALSVRYKWSTKCRLNGSTSGDPNGTSGRPVVGPLILSHFLSRLGTKRLIDCWTRRPSKGRWKPKRIRRIGAHTDSQKKVMESSLFGWSVGECVCVGSMGFTGPFFFKTLHKPTDKVADTFGINGAEEKDSNSKNQRTQTHTKKNNQRKHIELDLAESHWPAASPPLIHYEDFAQTAW